MAQPKNKPSNNKPEILPQRGLLWFIDRIGKTVYRRDTKQFGLIVKNEVHAKYLEMMEADLELNYDDKPFNEYDNTTH